MRLVKKASKIVKNERTEKIEPFRSFYLTPEEVERYVALPENDGVKVTSRESEAFLKDVLDARQMGSLLYPEREQDDWSGYVTVLDGGLCWLL